MTVWRARATLLYAKGCNVGDQAILGSYLNRIAQMKVVTRRTDAQEALHRTAADWGGGLHVVPAESQGASTGSLRSARIQPASGEAAGESH